MTKLKSQSEFTQMAYLGGENVGGLATGEGMDARVAFGPARERHRCCPGRMLRYPDCLVSGTGRLRKRRKGAQKLQQRINQSIVFRFMRKDLWMVTRGLTKMRIPSASFCQRSIILLSSSAALEYMKKKGPELSPKLDSPCND